MGQDLLTNKRFTILEVTIWGAEISGSYKNIIALASGIVSGLGLGKNMEAMLITRGLSEMIEYGTSLLDFWTGIFGQLVWGSHCYFHQW